MTSAAADPAVSSSKTKQSHAATDTVVTVDIIADTHGDISSVTLA
jgi:hypothetical protein